jgi:hypothetical protein
MLIDDILVPFIEIFSVAQIELIIESLAKEGKGAVCC